VLDVRQHQLLVLLLVLDAELDERQPLVVELLRIDGLGHLLLHVLAVGQHLVERRTRKHPALGTRMLVAHRVVVRIEKHAVGGVVQPVVGNRGREDERFEEPGGVPQVPFRRTGIGHRLDGAILGR
jgi:hypothetical protein